MYHLVVRAVVASVPNVVHQSRFVYVVGAEELDRVLVVLGKY